MSPLMHNAQSPCRKPLSGLAARTLRLSNAQMKISLPFLCALGSLPGACIGFGVSFGISCAVGGGISGWFLGTVLFSILGAILATALALALGMPMTSREKHAVPLILGIV